MQAIGEFAVRIVKGILSLLMLSMVAINLANVVGRKLFNQAIFWSEEIMLFLLVWSVFLGAIVITWQGRHLRMDLFTARLPPPWSYIVNGLVVVFFIAASGFMIRQSLQVVELMTITGQVSNAAKVPMVVLHSAVLLGFSAMIVVIIVRLRAYLTDRF